MADVNPTYTFNDYIKNLAGISIVLVNENANFPIENSQNEEIALCTCSTDKVNIKYQITLDDAKPIQLFFLGNHNFNGGTLDINSYTAADFAANKITHFNNITPRALDDYRRLSSAPAARKYWEYDFTNIMSADTYLKFGRVIIYDDWVKLKAVEDVRQLRGYHWNNIINPTQYKVRAGVHKLTERQEEFRLSWKRREDTYMPAELRTLYETVYGDAHPFVFIPSMSGTDCYYVYIIKPSLEWESINMPDIYIENLELGLIEAIRDMV